MTIRLATAADAPEIGGLLREFIEQTGGVAGAFDEGRYVAVRLQRWPLIQAVYLDDRGVVRVYCELKVREQGDPNMKPEHPCRNPNAEFAGAFPRGASKALIGPVFSFCAQDLLSRYRGRELTTWRGREVWGEFSHGQDAERVPDDGKGITESWRDYYEGRGRTSIRAERLPGSTLYIARMTLGELADDG